MKPTSRILALSLCAALSTVVVLGASGCVMPQRVDDNATNTEESASTNSNANNSANMNTNTANTSKNSNTSLNANANANTNSNTAASQQAAIDAARAKLNLTLDIRTDLEHGTKTAPYQKYIVLHDTEGDSDAESVIDYWESAGSYVAAQFIVNKDGSIVQCVDMDQIAHHAGFGDTGHGEAYGVTDTSRDDMRGTESIGSWASDYGMNSYSIGIEMVHVGGSGDYPEAQLEAVDNLIAYIDAYYGNESTIIDHKEWRTGNSDTSEEFAEYLANYKIYRTHDGS